jgi:alpha-beta hydrolase superfamily lysophospholipase
MRILVALTFALLCSVALFAAGPASAAKPRRAPSGLAFYTPPSPLPAGRHGDVIWSRTIRNSLPSAATTKLVLYRSTSVAGRPIAVSGVVVLPRRRPPRGGWPVVSWAHGTTGIADRCAPSRTPTSGANTYVSSLFDEWLRRGYAVARTDYEGLGTPGTHPYLIGRPEGRGVIDIVRAARGLDSRVGRRWLITGHSQGGHAALFAAADGPRWAPELRLRGVAAYAPASQVGTQARAIGALTQPSPLSGLAALIVEGAAAVSQDVKVPEIASDRALALRPQIHTRCVGQLTASDSYGALAPSELQRPGADLAALLRVLDAQNPALRIRVPVLIAQGRSDNVVFSFFTDELVKQLRGLGVRPDYRTYPGVDHGSIVVRSSAATRAFVRARLG